MMHRFNSIVAVLSVFSAVSLASATQPPTQPWFPKAPPLPAPAGQVIRVTNVQQLFQAADDINSGGTILVADGQYMMPRYFELHTDRVTLRSESGHRDRVVLDGAQSKHGELVGISHCRGVTISDLTIQNIKWNGFKINSNKYATHVTIRNCVIHNIWQRGIKGPAVDKKDRGSFWPTACRIEYCLFYNDRPKQYADDPTDTADTFKGNYIGGIDAMYANEWVIADNVFMGIHGRTGEGRGAVFLWNQSQDCTVERNIIVDCDCGICLGNHHRNAETRWHDRGCVVRNNLVTRCAETGILAAHTRDCQIIHNTIHDPASHLHRLLWVLDDNDGLLVANNLLSGPKVLDTGSSKITNRNNIAAANLADAFVDAQSGNLRLKHALTKLDGSIDSAATDIDGRQRPVHPNAGAHQFVASPAVQPKPLGAISSPQVRAGSRQAKTPPDWVAAMRQVHTGFHGTQGYVAQFGDSITYSMAFWSPMSWTYPDQYLTENDGFPKTPPNARWRDVLLGARDKGPKFANYSGWRVGQLRTAMGAVLEREKPEIAMIMIGSNDISGDRVPEKYAAQLAEVVEKCMTAHCVPLLSTIPPRRGHAKSVAKANQIIRRLAARKRVPLVDFYAACLRLQPGDKWDGTIISSDGVHPSGGETHVYTDENIRTCGYALRNWLNFQMVRQIYFHVLHPIAATKETSPRAAAADVNTNRQTVASHQTVTPTTRQKNLPGERSWTAVCSPRVLASEVADAYSMRTFGQFDRWRDLAPDAKAYEIYRYLADTHTGLFHMNVVAEGDDGLSEFVQIRDPVKIINVYGYAYCGILGPTMAGVCEGVGLGPGRTLVLRDWNHVLAETSYNGRWHYLDLDVRAVFRRKDGSLASMEEARQDASLWHDRGPLFFPNDPLDATRAIYQKTPVETYYGFQQSGHTMDYVLRPGERFTRWWQPQGGRWQHLERYNKEPWLLKLLEMAPRGPKPNHRHFSIQNHGNGQFVYEPNLTNKYSDFAHGVYDRTNVTVTEQGVTLQRDGVGAVVFEVRSPYIIVPQVGEMERVDDDCQASVIQFGGRHVTPSLSLDNGVTWYPLPFDGNGHAARDDTQAGTDNQTTTIDLTRWVSGRYGYLLKLAIEGRADDALLRHLKMTTWVQVAPASLPTLHKGRNRMTLVTGDHYGKQTRVVEVRSRASHPEQLLKYLVTPPRDYDPSRKSARIHGAVTVKVNPPPGTKIAWFTATGQFRTHQRDAAGKTNNQMAYAVNEPADFHVIYQADVPTYTQHWNYNAAREVVLDTPAKSLFVRYTGDPALNNFAIYAHCLPDRPQVTPPLAVTHTWLEDGKQKQVRKTLDEDGTYEVIVPGLPANVSIELAVKSLPQSDDQGLHSGSGKQ